MTDPDRISEPGLAKTLLDSLANDRPSASARQAAAAALGIRPGAAPAGGVTATKPATSSVVKGLLVALSGTALVVVALTAHHIMTSPAAVPAVAPPMALPTLPPPATPPPAIAEQPSPPPPAEERPVPVRPASRNRVSIALHTEPAPPRELERPAKAAAVDSDVSTLRDETALLDAARDALRRKAASSALETLDRYAQLFPHGVLDIEATALHVEALFLAGERKAAFALGQEFLERHGDSALGNRVRSLIAEEKSRDQTQRSLH